MRDELNVGYVFDEGFTVPAAVSIFSLLYNNRHLKKISLIILDDGITEDSRKKLTEMVGRFHRQIRFVDVSQVKERLTETTPFNWNGSYSTYIRLMLNTLLPGSEEKVLMIDADTVITGKLDGLLDMDFSGKVCAMALEAMPKCYHKHSGLGMHELYNGGLIYVDLKEWKEKRAEERIFDFLINVRERNMLTDEDVLSAVFKGEIARIPVEYNYLTQYYLYASGFYYRFLGWGELAKEGVFYSLSEMQEARGKVKMYHCIDTFTNRPWFSNNFHPYTKLFDMYLAHTPWKDYKKKKKKMSLLTRIEYILRRILPDRLSRFEYAISVKLYYGIGAKRYYGRDNR